MYRNILKAKFQRLCGLGLRIGRSLEHSLLCYSICLRISFPAMAIPVIPLVNALYTGSERGLTADILAAKAMGLQPMPVCTSIISASHGEVTDVLAVPTDSVKAQLEHLGRTTEPVGAKIGIIGHHKTVDAVFKTIPHLMEGPLLLDLTLSGPSGEDIINQQGREALVEHLPLTELVTLRRRDAELLAGMEIKSLDDAQVAVQRLHKQGASHVHIRCGNIPARHFQDAAETSEFAVDLYYDGDDFALFEAPLLPTNEQQGASSVLTLAILAGLLDGQSLIAALQKAKGVVTESIQAGLAMDSASSPDYFWDLRAG